MCILLIAATLVPALPGCGVSTARDATRLEFRASMNVNSKQQPWWPTETCVPVEDAIWQISVPLGGGEAPVELDASVQYVVRAYQQDGPNIVSTFAFDVAGPPTPSP
jgi:hypothetical protein